MQGEEIDLYMKATGIVRRIDDRGGFIHCITNSNFGCTLVRHRVDAPRFIHSNESSNHKRFTGCKVLFLIVISTGPSSFNDNIAVFT